MMQVQTTNANAGNLLQLCLFDLILSQLPCVVFQSSYTSCRVQQENPEHNLKCSCHHLQQIVRVFASTVLTSPRVSAIFY